MGRSAHPARPRGTMLFLLLTLVTVLVWPARSNGSTDTDIDTRPPRAENRKTKNSRDSEWAL
eukprot:scaffold253767_cov35-Tisochrysis_lutea.AAC.1